MAAALRECKKHYKVGCITNNMKKAGEGPAMAASDERAEFRLHQVMAQFDIVVESSLEGVPHLTRGSTKSLATAWA